ncbi:zinc-dependent alcohol dehydrogenase family protein [Oricola cellulosilytica]|uniref:Alcohol dehydrogenase n=1 Tax=Oricola cellulosilytica TaxID=1429082 RepID=A0A4R0PM38_9HYPH|nr:zinc-dependent alcohol dehydrogenase family protein [Oricola cellulosilytica]TCD16449.1 alcohol dehydrogenase [Oricola cellulosilytica]
MKAVVIREFGVRPSLETVPDPEPSPDGVVVKVEATGVCRSDWHGWIGHDTSIALPHVPGHELAGTVVAVGRDVRRWRDGDRVTVPFVAGCGHCGECASGNQHVCPDQYQPGFAGWGSFAEFVALRYADANLVRLPDDMASETAASLGCRFVTSFRAVVDKGRVSAGEWVAVHGCGGVGLSAIMIASAAGARVIAVDITAEKLKLARKLGAEFTVDAATGSAVKAIREISSGGAHLLLDALGSTDTFQNSVKCLRTRGRHVQVGLLLGEHRNPPAPMARVIALELELHGSHGMQAFRYDAAFNMIASGRLRPERMIGKRLTLEQSIDVLAGMENSTATGIPVVTSL